MVKIRMWMINPILLCRNHLLGEHSELHKHLPSFRKKHKIDGRFSPVVQIELCSLKERYDILAIEMIRRGYNHKSPLINIPDLKSIYPQHYHKKVSIFISIKDLCERCSECEKKILLDFNTIGSF